MNKLLLLKKKIGSCSGSYKSLNSESAKDISDLINE
jgi:hypothetical protein